MSSNSLDDLRDLSDEDVRLLYDIVVAAENSKSPPFRALFAAYEKELAKQGISKDHDQVYLRFLLRMGESRKDGHGLYEQFEALLAKLGFEVAFDGEEREAEDGEREEGVDQSTSPPRINLLQTQSFRPSRRASYDSALDTITETKPLAVLPVRPNSTDPRPGVSPRRAHSRTSSRSHATNINTQRGDRLRPPPHDIPRPLHPSQPAPPSALQDFEERPESEQTLADESDAPSELTGSEFREEAEGFDHGEPPNSVYGGDVQASEAFKTLESKKKQLEANAKTLKYHHVAARAVLLFRDWSESAKGMRRSHEQMFATARCHDANILKSQALDQWRLALREKRRATETEKFFGKLEARAAKARDLFLLTKSFTHWAQCASEETSRRTAARKLILQTRYFNTWRDITVVNELKARRLCLAKFFSTWVKRAEHVLDNDDRAEDFDTVRSVRFAYRQWFWAFCERRTPSWYMSKRKSAIFRKWLDMARETQIRRAWAVDFRELELQRSCVAQWARRAGLVLQNNHAAAEFRRRGILAPSIESLRRELQLGPLQSRVSYSLDVRVARSAFQIWRRKADDIRYASRINELRTMRNAWTSWNDLLRCRALSHVMDERIVLQALYKWVLAERLAICEKAKDDDLEKAFFIRWRAMTNALAARLRQAEDSAVLSQKKRTALSVLKQWSTEAKAEQQEKARAQNYHRERLVSKTLTRWTSRSHDVALLNKWSENARFFVLASSSIKTWRAKTIASKRARRREAFASFTRKSKAAAAKRLFERWHEATLFKIQLNGSGEEMQRKHFQAVVANALDGWRNRLLIVQNHESEAEQLCEEHASRRSLLLLVSRFQKVQELVVAADEFSAGILESAAASSLRKLNWRAFQVKRQHESAESLLQRNQKKHNRQILRHVTSTMVRRLQMGQSTREQDPDPDAVQNQMPPRGSLSRRETPLLGRSSRRNESKSTSRLDALRPTQAPAATPAYLRTPSRRTTIGKARANPSALTQPRLADTNPAGPTTPSTTHITPFMNRLRAQYRSSANLGSSFGPGVHTAGFEDIPESPGMDFDESEVG